VAVSFPWRTCPLECKRGSYPLRLPSREGFLRPVAAQAAHTPAQLAALPCREQPLVYAAEWAGSVAGSQCDALLHLGVPLLDLPHLRIPHALHRWTLRRTASETLRFRCYCCLARPVRRRRRAFCWTASKSNLHTRRSNVTLPLLFRSTPLTIGPVGAIAVAAQSGRQRLHSPAAEGMAVARCEHPDL
jgi:hypothetical protein